MPKTVLITGSNRGIGLAFVQHYKNQGWNVIAAARNIKDAEELKAQSPWKLVQLDVSNEQSILAAAQELQSVPIDLLINNAGIGIFGDFTQTTKEDMMKQFEVNAVAPFLITRALLPNLKLAASQSKSPAIVAQVTSRMGSVDDNTSGGYYGYRASKSALNIINKSLSLDLQQDNVIAVLVHPGYVRTGMTSNNGNVTAEESVAGMTKILSEVKMEDAGKFYHFQGEILPW